MITVAVTGSNGFIGSNFIKAAQGRFNIKLIGPRVDGTDPAAVRVSLRDESGLSEALSGCDAIVHCAHTGADESENAVWAANLVKAATRADVTRMVAFGSFATYDNSGQVISRSTRNCTARIPYIVEKLRLENTYAALMEGEYRSLHLAFLQPTIVVGKKGSWDRFARALQQTRLIYLPNKGNGVCNLVPVETVVDAVCRCLEAPADFYRQARMRKLIVAQNSALTWAEWLERDYGIPAARIEECNANTWAESFKRNLMLSFRYSVLGDMLMRLKRSRTSMAPEQPTDKSGSTERAVVESPAVYLPEGFDRLTFSCKAVAKKDALP
jgi:nucleoside-diphosphate-sugar epimerase